MQRCRALSWESNLTWGFVRLWSYARRMAGILSHMFQALLSNRVSALCQAKDPDEEVEHLRLPGRAPDLVGRALRRGLHHLPRQAPLSSCPVFRMTSGAQLTT